MILAGEENIFFHTSFLQLLKSQISWEEHCFSWTLLISDPSHPLFSAKTFKQPNFKRISVKFSAVLGPAFADRFVQNK